MTTQAKNRFLAYIILAMLAIVALVGTAKQDRSVAVLIPSQTPTVVFVTPDPIPYEWDEFECMRSNLYFEARNQKKVGMEAVALVTLTRTKTKHYPATVCNVVKAWAYNKRGVKVCAFSWYCDGKPDRANMSHPDERKVWQEATKIADKAMRGKIKDFLGGATHYHAFYVNPDWANVPKRYHRLTRIGAHIFYKDIALGRKVNA